MAVVKMTYTRSKDAIKAHLRYIVHRPGKAWEKATRELFQHNYLSVTKQDTYDRINAAPRNTIFYKMMRLMCSHRARCGMMAT
jgi:predicted nucleotidyltransferase